VKRRAWSARSFAAKLAQSKPNGMMAADAIPATRRNA
jgi:hypothetical protein